MKLNFLFLTAAIAFTSTAVFGDETFAKYDSNRDGAVEYRELAMAKKKSEFDRMDRNRDKAVTSQEFAAVEIEKGGEYDLFATPEFKVIDGDSNGTVTLVEFGATVKGLIEKVDASGDSKVTTEEYAASVKKAKDAAAAAAAAKNKGSAPKGSGPKGSTPK